MICAAPSASLPYSVGRSAAICRIRSRGISTTSAASVTTPEVECGYSSSSAPSPNDSPGARVCSTSRRPCSPLTISTRPLSRMPKARRGWLSRKTYDPGG
jgi:hypothetical protein